MTKNTATHILEVATELMCLRGYHGVSFQQVAAQVGLRKASLYHHFATKAALGAAVLERAVARVEAETLAALRQPDAIPAFDAFLAAMTGEEAALIVVLGAEMPGLPAPMHAALAAHFPALVNRLSDLLARERATGAFHFTMAPRSLAALIVDHAQGQLIVRRAGAESEAVPVRSGVLEHLIGVKAVSPDRDEQG